MSPSYLHPDENFQGPEVIAGKQKRPLVTIERCAGKDWRKRLSQLQLRRGAELTAIAPGALLGVSGFSLVADVLTNEFATQVKYSAIPCD